MSGYSVPGYAIEYRLFSADTTLSFAGNQADRRSLFRRAGERNDRIRRGRGSGTDGRNQRFAEASRRRTSRAEAGRVLYRRVDRRLGDQRSRPSLTACSRAEPNIGFCSVQDNADIRLTPVSHKIGLANDERYRNTMQKKSSVESLISFARRQSVAPAEIESYFEIGRFDAADTKPKDIRRAFKKQNHVFGADRSSDIAKKLYRGKPLHSRSDRGSRNTN